MCLGYGLHDPRARGEGQRLLDKTSQRLDEDADGTREEILGTTLLDVSIGDSNVPILFTTSMKC